MMVWSWLKIDPSNLKTFVGNRVSKIISISDIEQWHHVKSEDNAADIISRGLNPKELLENKIWFNGPDFLKNAIFNLESNNTETCLESLPDMKTNSVLLAFQDQVINFNKVNESETSIEILNRYSSLTKLQRVMAYICRFKNKTLKRSIETSKELTTDELEESLFIFIKLAQKEVFSEEIYDLETKNSQNHKHSFKFKSFFECRSSIKSGW